MARSTRDKAANRRSLYQTEIAEKQALADHRGAFDAAKRWLLSEVARAARQRPADAPQMYADVTERLAAIAEALPYYRPAKQHERR